MTIAEVLPSSILIVFIKLFLSLERILEALLFRAKSLIRRFLAPSNYQRSNLPRRHLSILNIALIRLEETHSHLHGIIRLPLDTIRSDIVQVMVNRHQEALLIGKDTALVRHTIVHRTTIALLPTGLSRVLCLVEHQRVASR